MARLNFFLSSTVRLDWSSVFRGEDSVDCSEVDFMVKSHPRFQASAYKLSDLTAKGQASAVLNVDASSDFVFQAHAHTKKEMHNNWHLLTRFVMMKFLLILFTR